MFSNFDGQRWEACVSASNRSPSRAAMLLLAVGAALGLAAPMAHAALLVDEGWNYSMLAKGATMNGVTANALGLSGTYSLNPADTVPTFTYNNSAIAFGNLKQSGGSVSFSNSGNLGDYTSQQLSVPISVSSTSSTLYGSYVVDGTVVNSGISGAANNMEMAVNIGQQYAGENSALINPMFEGYNATFGQVQAGSYTTTSSTGATQYHASANAALTAGSGVTSYAANNPYLVLFEVTGVGASSGSISTSEWVLNASQYNNFATTNTLNATDLTAAGLGTSATNVTAYGTASSTPATYPTLTGQYLNLGGYDAGTHGTTTFGEVRLSSASLAEAAPIARTTVSANLNDTVTASTMGLGVQWDPYDFQPSASEWNTIIQRLNYMDPSFIRDMNDTGNATDTRILAWAQQHNSKVIFGTWTPSPLNGTSTPTTSAITTWAATTAQYVAGLNKQYGNVIHYYNFVNEPNRLSISTWSSMANALQSAFAKAGLGNSVQVVGPDTFADPGSKAPSSTTWPLLQSLAQQQAAGSTNPGLFDIHWYPGSNSEVTSGSIQSTLTQQKQMVISADPAAANTPFIVGEAGLGQGATNGSQPNVTTFSYGVMMADYAVQALNAGWSISAWDLDDAMHVTNSDVPPGPTTLKEWGFWNSEGPAMGNPAAFNIRPWFYTWSLMSRLFPGGTKIVGTSVPTSMSNFRMLTGIRVVNGKTVISIELVNDGTSEQSILVQIPTLTTPLDLTQYSYFSNNMPVDANGFPIPSALLNQVNLSQGLQINMPANGVMFLTDAPVPEPGSLSLLLLAGSALLFRRLRVRPRANRV